MKSHNLYAISEFTGYADLFSVEVIESSIEENDRTTLSEPACTRRLSFSLSGTSLMYGQSQSVSGKLNSVTTQSPSSVPSISAGLPVSSRL